MKIIEPRFKIMVIMASGKTLELIEDAGRTCYKSESDQPAEKFVAMIVKRGHHSVLEHSCMTVRFICDRGVSHEIVRHRLASYSQESTRYCNYEGVGITLIHPSGLSFMQRSRREDHFWDVQRLYDEEIRDGLSPQIARGVLPTALKTEIVMSANFREWRHIFTLRCAKAAHPQMREIMIPLLTECKKLIPIIFNDIG